MFTLSNGHRVLKATINGETDKQLGVVLAEWQTHGHGDSFVTWSIFSVDGEFITHTGHYFTRLEDAELDYKQRIIYI